MFFRHPSKRALREWLDNAELRTPEEEADSSIDTHLDTCHRCAAVLDDMAEGAQPTLNDALAAFYSAPPDLSDRLERRVTERLDSRVVLDVVSDLFGAGIETSKLLLMEEPESE